MSDALSIILHTFEAADFESCSLGSFPDVSVVASLLIRQVVGSELDRAAKIHECITVTLRYLAVPDGSALGGDRGQVPVTFLLPLQGENGVSRLPSRRDAETAEFSAAYVM